MKGRPANDEERFKTNMHKIIKIQSVFRGIQARRYISMLRSKQIGSSKYFTYEESRETVTKRLYNPDQ